MKKTSLLWLFALAVIAGISPGASGAGCFETYKSHVEALKQKTITPEQRDDLHRWALRAQHACETGDLPDVDGLFEKLDRKRLQLLRGLAPPDLLGSLSNSVPG